jgi:hypothetical protein
MKTHKHSLTRTAKNFCFDICFGLSWLVLLSTLFVVTFLVLDDFPIAEGNVAGIVLGIASSVVMVRGLMRLKAASDNAAYRYAPGVYDICV